MTRACNALSCRGWLFTTWWDDDYERCLGYPRVKYMICMSYYSQHFKLEIKTPQTSLSCLVAVPLFQTWDSPPGEAIEKIGQTVVFTAIRWALGMAQQRKNICNMSVAIARAILWILLKCIFSECSWNLKSWKYSQSRTSTFETSFL